MKSKNIFITGTGTDVGKTIVSACVVEALEADYWKIIQCGNLENGDKETVKSLITNKNSNIFPELYTFQAPQSPHYAAELENKKIEISSLPIPETQKHLIMEGAGGICVPLNDEQFITDLLSKETPIILVSKNELGSINHTLLSVYYLKNEGFKNVSLIFVGEEKPSTENYIIEKTQVPNLGRIPWTENLNKEFIKNQSEILKNTLNTFILNVENQ